MGVWEMSGVIGLLRSDERLVRKLVRKFVQVNLTEIIQLKLLEVKTIKLHSSQLPFTNQS